MSCRGFRGRLIIINIYTCHNSIKQLSYHEGVRLMMPNCHLAFQVNAENFNSCGPVSVSIFVQFFFQLMCILCHYHFFLQSIPSIYTSLGKTVLFCIVQANSFLQFFLVSPQILASPFLFNVRSFLSVSSRLFINLIIVIKSPLSLLSFSVVRCISINLSSYVRSFNSGTILIAILLSVVPWELLAVSYCWYMPVRMICQNVFRENFFDHASVHEWGQGKGGLA